MVEVDVDLSRLEIKFNASRPEELPHIPTARHFGIHEAHMYINGGYQVITLLLSGDRWLCK